MAEILAECIDTSPATNIVVEQEIRPVILTSNDPIRLIPGDKADRDCIFHAVKLAAVPEIDGKPFDEPDRNVVNAAFEDMPLVVVGSLMRKRSDRRSSEAKSTVVGRDSLAVRQVVSA